MPPATTAPTAPPLAAGQHVIVRMLHTGTLPATIETADGAAVTAALAVRDERLARLIGHDIAVEVSSGRGIYKHTGSLKSERNGVLQMELIGVERIQRREFVRVAAHVTVNVRGIDEPLGGETVTIDISGAGIRISDPWSLPLGLDVRVELQLPGAGDPVHALGRVVRAAAENEKGISIEDLGRADEDRLIRFIRERELQALRAARTA
jgi:hypothetical protein